MAGKELAVIEHAPTVAMVAEIETWIGANTNDSNAVANAILERILAAPDIESAFGVGGLAKGSDWIDRPFTVQGVHWNESHFEDSIGVYAVMDAIDPMTGESVQIGTGARQSIAQLYVAARMGWYPLQLMIRRAPRPNKNGHYAQWLELVAS